MPQSGTNACYEGAITIPADPGSDLSLRRMKASSLLEGKENFNPIVMISSVCHFYKITPLYKKISVSDIMTLGQL